MQCLLRTSFPFPRGGEGEKGNSESRSKEHWILTREILVVNKTLTSESERNLLNIMRLDETARRGKAPHCSEKKEDNHTNDVEFCYRLPRTYSLHFLFISSQILFLIRQISPEICLER